MTNNTFHDLFILAAILEAILNYRVMQGLPRWQYRIFTRYECHSRISDNKSISQKVLLESELFLIQNVDIGAACSFLKHGVFITTRFDARRICIQHYECSWPKKISIFTPFCLGVYSYISGC